MCGVNMSRKRGKEHTLWWPFAWIWILIQIIAGFIFILNFFQTNLNNPLNFLLGLPLLVAVISFILDFFGIKKRELS
jgi:polyferredoxin